MNLFTKFLLFTGFMFCWGADVFSQTRFHASISPTKIYRDEYTTLRVVIENASDIQKISPPALKDFHVVSGPNQESGMSTINGVVQQYIALSYVLLPKKTGKINIAACQAIIGGKSMKTQPVGLYVIDQISGRNSPQNAQVSPYAAFDPFSRESNSPEFDDYILKKGEDIAHKVSRNMELKLQTNKSSCYVGEPIVAAYKLYTRLKSESKLTKNPSFNGFSVIDLQQPDATEYAREKLGGKDYNVYTIRKAQLYPLQPGEIELESAVLENQVQFVKAENASDPANINGLFNGIITDPNSLITQAVNLSSKPVTVHVKPLPENGKPSGFSGAVGQFTISWGLEKNDFNTDEAGALIVNISGSGNLQLITSPEILWPAGIQAFDPVLNDNLVTRNVPVSGTKSFRYAFTADKAGSFTIPALKFSYFDPSAEVYKTLSTQPLGFTVSAGKGTRRSNIVSDLPAKKEDDNFFSLPSVIGLISGALGIALLVWLLSGKRSKKHDLAKKEIVQKDISPIINEEQIPARQNPLEETEACLYREDCIEFYQILNRELRQFLAHEFSLNEKDISSKTIMSVMDKSGIENEVMLSLQSFLQEIEWQLYTPFQAGKNRNEIYSQAQEIVQVINRYHQKNQTVNL